ERVAEIAAAAAAGAGTVSHRDETAEATTRRLAWPKRRESGPIPGSNSRWPAEDWQHPAAVHQRQRRKTVAGRERIPPRSRGGKTGGAHHRSTRRRCAAAENGDQGA